MLSPVIRLSWGWGACPQEGPGCIHLVLGRGPAGSLPSLTACLSLCRHGSEGVVLGGGESGCGCGPQTLGYLGRGASGKTLLCGPCGQPVVLALELGTWSGPPCAGRGAAWSAGLWSGSSLCGDFGAGCPLGAGPSLHPVCPGRVLPCRDGLSVVGVSVLGRGAGCKEGCCQACGVGGERPSEGLSQGQWDCGPCP